MKIAIIQTSLVEPTGGERQSLMLAISLQKMGHEVTIFTQAVSVHCFPELQKQVTIVAASTFLQRTEQNVVQKRMNIPALYVLRYFKCLFQVFFFYRSIKDTLSKFDVINPHNFPMEWVSFFVKRDFPNKQIVWMCNEPPFYYFSQQNLMTRLVSWPIFYIFDKCAVRAIDKIVTLDRLNQSRVLSIYGREPRLIRSGAEIETVSHSAAELSDCRRKFNLLDDSFIVLSVATLAPYKRPDKTLLAIQKLHNKIPTICGIFVGSGEMEQVLQDMSVAMSLSDSIHFIKHVSESDLAMLYDICNVYVFPANQTWGLSAVEAMLHAKPVLVSRDCGVSEIVTDWENGVLVDGDNAVSIADAIFKLYKNNTSMCFIGSSARKYVLENLSWTKYAEKMASQFEN